MEANRVLNANYANWIFLVVSEVESKPNYTNSIPGIAVVGAELQQRQTGEAYNEMLTYQI